MEKWFKYILSFVAGALVIGIIVAINMPKPKMTLFDKIELSKMIDELNDDLPMEIGTIGYLDSIKNVDQTFIYYMSVKGDNGIKQVYTENYNEFKNLLKYNIVLMNGQKKMGSILAKFLEDKDLSMGARIYTPNRDYVEWKITGSELMDFVESCRLDPTETLQQVIDMQIKIANLDLPMKPGDSTPIRSVTLNSIEQEGDDSYLLQSVSHVGNTITFLYDVDETMQDLDVMIENSDNEEFLENLVALSAEDADIKAFFDLVAISHSNILFRCVGRSSGKVAEIVLPYGLLRRYCKVPSYLLSN